MGNKHLEHQGLSTVIWEVADKLIELLHPELIYLYNHRTGTGGATTSFKLCVVANMPDKHRAEHTAYLSIDTDIPFDLLLYTPEEWREIAVRKDSFASRICKTGMILYG